MPQPRAAYQRELFEEPPAVPALRLPPDIQEQLRQTLVQWMQTVAKTIQQEEADEQNHG